MQFSMAYLNSKMLGIGPSHWKILKMSRCLKSIVWIAYKINIDNIDLYWGRGARESRLLTGGGREGGGVKSDGTQRV